MGNVITESTYKIGNMTFRHLSDHGFLDLQDKTIRLASKEKNLLRMLYEAADEGREMLTREEALASLFWDTEANASRTLDVYMTRLRKYLHEGDDDVEIQSMWGMGFRLMVKINATIINNK